MKGSEGILSTLAVMSHESGHRQVPWCKHHRQSHHSYRRDNGHRSSRLRICMSSPDFATLPMALLLSSIYIDSRPEKHFADKRRRKPKISRPFAFICRSITMFGDHVPLTNHVKHPLRSSLPTWVPRRPTSTLASLASTRRIPSHCVTSLQSFPISLNRPGFRTPKNQASASFIPRH